MTKDQMFALEPGDVVRSCIDPRIYVVTGNYGGRITAARTMDITNPEEWDLVRTHSQRVKP